MLPALRSPAGPPLSCASRFGSLTGRSAIVFVPLAVDLHVILPADRTLCLRKLRRTAGLQSVGCGDIRKRLIASRLLLCDDRRGIARLRQVLHKGLAHLLRRSRCARLQIEEVLRPAHAGGFVLAEILTREDARDR